MSRLEQLTRKIADAAASKQLDAALSAFASIESEGHPIYSHSPR